MNDPKSKKSLEELIEKRRRERWKALLTPFIYMASIVGSVAMILAFIKSCSDRFPPTP